jgi:hypothetical protein
MKEEGNPFVRIAETNERPASYVPSCWTHTEVPFCDGAAKSRVPRFVRTGAR